MPDDQSLHYGNSVMKWTQVIFLAVVLVGVTAGFNFGNQQQRKQADPTFSLGETERPPLPVEPTLGDRLIDTSLSTVMGCVFLGLICGVIWLLRSGFNRVFQVEITCRKCGHVSKDESLDCVRCGTKLA
jgi:hypothetical protein